MHETSTGQVKGVIFDLDGTLYRMRWFIKPLLAARLFPRIGRLPAYMKVRAGFSGKDLGGNAALLKAMAERLAVREHSNVNDMLAWINRGFYSAFVSIMPRFRNTRPGIPHALAALRAKHVRLAVLSDFAAVPERLEKLGIDPALFDAIESAETFGTLKPHPRPFMHIAGNWDMACGDILVIGDRDDTDGAASRACGMRFLQITDGRPHGSVKRWTDVKAVLDSLPPV